jgi:hypothetical protein
LSEERERDASAVSVALADGRMTDVVENDEASESSSVEWREESESARVVGERVEDSNVVEASDRSAGERGGGGAALRAYAGTRRRTGSCSGSGTEDGADA